MTPKIKQHRQLKAAIKIPQDLGGQEHAVSREMRSIESEREHRAMVEKILARCSGLGCSNEAQDYSKTVYGKACVSCGEKLTPETYNQDPLCLACLPNTLTTPVECCSCRCYETCPICGDEVCEGAGC